MHTGKKSHIKLHIYLSESNSQQASGLTLKIFNHCSNQKWWSYSKLVGLANPKGRKPQRRPKTHNKNLEVHWETPDSNKKNMYLIGT